jgi:hypothetical protein
MIFEIEDADGGKIASQAVNIINNPAKAADSAAHALGYARNLQDNACNKIFNNLPVLAYTESHP